MSCYNLSPTLVRPPHQPDIDLPSYDHGKFNTPQKAVKAGAL